MGNVKSFVDKLDMQAINIDEIEEVNEPYILISPTIGQGQVPYKVLEFLNRGDNGKYLRGVASSGNRIFKGNYGRCADIISNMFKVPIILKFELKGVKGDVIKFKERVQELYELH